MTALFWLALLIGIAAGARVIWREWCAAQAERDEWWDR
jgi:hypothetical protein